MASITTIIGLQSPSNRLHFSLPSPAIKVDMRSPPSPRPCSSLLAGHMCALLLVAAPLFTGASSKRASGVRNTTRSSPRPDRSNGCWRPVPQRHQLRLIPRRRRAELFCCSWPHRCRTEVPVCAVLRPLPSHQLTIIKASLRPSRSRALLSSCAIGR
jgi:hypothetical protein